MSCRRQVEAFSEDNRSNQEPVVSCYSTSSPSIFLSAQFEVFEDHPTADLSVTGKAVAQGASVRPFLSVGGSLVVPALWATDGQMDTLLY